MTYLHRNTLAVLFLIGLLSPTVLRGQIITNMIDHDTVTIEACTYGSGVIYDDGGSLASYRNNFDGSVHLMASTGITLTLKGTIKTEGCCDHITIEDATGTLYGPQGGEDSIDVSTDNGWLLIRFTTDGSVTSSGFELEWSSSGQDEACPNLVTALTTTTVTTTSIGLSWSADNTSGPFTLICNDEIYSGITSTSYTLNGLSPSSFYNIKVVASESVGNSCCASNLSTRTACGIATLPYTEGFEGLDEGSFPPCWVMSINFDNEESIPQTVATHHSNGHRSLMLSCGNTESAGHFGIVATPPLSGTAERTLRLNLRSSHSDAMVEFGTCDSTGSDYNQYGFVSEQTVNVSNTEKWQTYTFTWTPSENGRRLALRMLQSNQGGVGRRVYIDEMGVEACGVDSVKAIHIEYNQLEVVWTTFGSPTCKVGIRREGTLEDSLTFDNATSPLLITGLSPETRYQITVYPTCGTESGISRHTLARTSIMPRAAEGYCSNFSQSTQLPYEWTFRVINGYCSPSFSCWDRSILFRDGCSSADALMASERLIGLAGQEVSVTYSGDNNGAWLIIGTMIHPDDTNTFVPYDTSYSDGGRHTRVIHIPDTSTGRHIAMRFINPGWYISTAIRCVSCSHCALEEGRVLHRRGTNFVLGWAKAYDTVLVQYGPKGFDLGSGTIDTFYNVSRATIDGLTPNTEYDIFMYRPCQTPCEDMRYTRSTASQDYTIPYCENLDNLTGNEWDYSFIDWERKEEVNGTPKFSAQYYNYTGQALQLTSWGFNWGYNAIAVLPDVEKDSNTVLSFYAFDVAPKSSLIIGVVYDDNIGGKFYPLDTIAIQSPSQRTHYRYKFQPCDTLFDGRIALCYTHPFEFSNYSLFIDELHFCHQAYDTLKINYIGQDSVGLSISGLYKADSVEVCLIGDNDTICKVIQLADISSFGFGGLDSGSFYHCFVRPLDGGCRSYATSFSLVGGAGYANCFHFDELLSDELPREWAVTNGVALSLDDAMGMPPQSAMSMHIMSGVDSLTFSFNARGRQAGDTLLLGYLPGNAVARTVTSMASLPETWKAFDTLVLDTAWQFHILTLPSFTDDSLRLTFVAGNDTAWVDDVGIIDCPIVRFKVDGNRIICTQDRQFSYYLTLDDTSGTDHRVILVSENPYIIEGLHLGTRYNLSWECLYRNTSCLPTVSVSTGAIIPLPYCEDFNKTMGSLSVPPTWSYIKNHPNDEARLDTWGPSLYISSAQYGKWTYAVLPQFAVDSVLSLVAEMSCNGTTEVGVLDNGTDTSSFITLWTSEQNVNYKNPALDLTAYYDKRIAIRTKVGFYLFNIHVYNIPMARVRLLGADSLSLVTSKAAPYWLRYHRQNWGDGYDLDTILALHDTLNLLVDNHRDYVYLTQGCDSTGYSCDNERQYRLGQYQSLPYCFDPEYGLWPWDLFTYHSTYRYGYLEHLIPTYTNRHVMRMDVKSSLWSVGPDLQGLDSIRHGGMRIEYAASSEYDSLEVGVLVDAYDTSTFTPLDTLVFNPAAEEIQSAYIDLSKYFGGGRWIALHTINSPQGNWFDVVKIYLDGCPASLGATASLTRWNRVKIDSPHTPFYMEYYPTGTSSQGSPGNTVVKVDSVPQILVLEPETQYDFHFRCDSLSYTCVPQQQVTTLAAPLDLPACIDFDTVPIGTTPRNWTSRHAGIGVVDSASHSASNSLAIPISTNSYIITPDINIDSINKVALSLWFKVEDPADRLVIGVMSNPADLSTFHPIRTLTPTEKGVWQRGMVEFSNAPDETHFIAIRARSNRQPGGRSILVDDIFVTDCAAFNLTVDKLTNNSIDLSWNQVGSPEITVTVLDSDAVVQVYTNPTSPLHIEPLTVLHYYTFRFNSHCNDLSTYCTTDYEDSLSVVTPAPGVGCVNPTDLSSPQAVFYRGTYKNPYAHAGAVNYGSLHPDSRHTVCYDTAQRDPRTGSQLRTIPEGYTSSVRLGNWSTNYFSPEAEGVIYSLFVDTANFELLLLRYAAVLQDPIHAYSDQPRFRMELLDTNYNIIDSACTSADFIADQSLGWNVADDGVLWKDWTSVGVDLSSHAGEQVYFRLTTYDCNEGSHYGYAYFTLECKKKDMNSASCGEVDSNTLAAPEGFHYRWYTSESFATVSTEQVITVPSQDITYYCEVSKLDNPSCQFLISAYGGTRYPAAAFDTTMTIDSCRFHVNFINQSSVSKDGVTPIPGEQCETAYWDFGNGTTSTDLNGEATYLAPGIYTVRLISGIASDACQDTAIMELNLKLPDGMAPSDTTWASICSNEQYTFFGTDYNIANTYVHNVPVPGKTCDSLYFLILDVRSTSVDDTVAESCDTFTWLGDTHTSSGIYTTPVIGTNSVGCDSTRALHLTIHQSRDTAFADTIVQNMLPYIVGTEAITFADLVPVNKQYARIDTTLTIATTHGCDSTVALSLIVWLNRDTVLDTMTCQYNLPFTYHDTSLSPTASLTIFNYLLPTTHGADSLVTIQLTLTNNPTAYYYDTIVQNDLPHTYRDHLFHNNTDTTFVVNNEGSCDSIIHYSLFVWNNVKVYYFRSICSNELPYTWGGQTFTGPDSITFTIPNSHGADSTVTLKLEVRQAYSFNDSIVFCPYQPYIYHGVDFGGPTVIDSVMTTFDGCDSVLHVHLVPRDSSYSLHVLYRSDSTEWLPTDTLIATCAPTTVDIIDSTPTSRAWIWHMYTPDTSFISTDTTVTLHLEKGSNNMAAYVNLIATDTLGCYDTLAWPLFGFPTPMADFRWEPDIPAIHQPEAQFYNLSLPDSLDYLWNIQPTVGSSSYDTSTARNPYYKWGEPGDETEGEYLVQLKVGWLHEADSFMVDSIDWIERDMRLSLFVESFTHTCYDSTVHTVIITNDYLQFPNVVTPNGDDYNDIWSIPGLVEYGNYSMNELWIYDRTGVLVYHVKNINKEEQFWDPNKTHSPDGTYYFHFSGKGQYGVVKRNGVIEVTRKTENEQ